jgi:hypothetical protein
MPTPISFASRCGNAVASEGTRLAAPLTGMKSTIERGEGTRAYASHIASITPSLRPSTYSAFQ